ncbi:hypothetical protein V8C44DRAFT_280466 [Trichoderma aethiopicum]
MLHKMGVQWALPILIFQTFADCPVDLNPKSGDYSAMGRFSMSRPNVRWRSRAISGPLALLATGFALVDHFRLYLREQWSLCISLVTRS